MNAALEIDPFVRHNKLKKVFESLFANPFLLLPIIVDLFISVIEKPGAKHAFESAFRNSTTASIDLDRLKKIKYIPSLIIWGDKDNLIPSRYAINFKQILSNSQFVMIPDAGHSPFVEKTAIIYQKLLIFLLEAKKETRKYTGYRKERKNKG